VRSIDPLLTTIISATSGRGIAWTTRPMDDSSLSAGMTTAIRERSVDVVPCSRAGLEPAPPRLFSLMNILPSSLGPWLPVPGSPIFCEYCYHIMKSGPEPILFLIVECISSLGRHPADIFRFREPDGEETKKICKVLNISATNYQAPLHRAHLPRLRSMESYWTQKSFRRTTL
jgi:hypothetical protein